MTAPDLRRLDYSLGLPHGGLMLIDENDFRQWTVVAVVVDANRVGLLPIGMVMAGDLNLAADQVCDRLPAPDGTPGARYLVASPCTLEVDSHIGRVVTVPQLTWVNHMRWFADAWVATDWLPAEGGLRMLDPDRWRTQQHRATGTWHARKHRATPDGSSRLR